jgi:hypothetical protein
LSVRPSLAALSPWELALKAALSPRSAITKFDVREEEGPEVKPPHHDVPRLLFATV